jgi:hypothetical protein
MMKGFLRRVTAFALLAVLAAGCGQTPSRGAVVKSTPTGKEVAKTEPAGQHDGWWCDEHGLPESVCDQCSKKYRAAEKAKGNWCEHERVKTSCFKCNPGLKEKYAADYKAKFGKAPPPTEDEETK